MDPKQKNNILVLILSEWTFRFFDFFFFLTCANHNSKARFDFFYVNPKTIALGVKNCLEYWWTLNIRCWCWTQKRVCRIRKPTLFRILFFKAYWNIADIEEALSNAQTNTCNKLDLTFPSSSFYIGFFFVKMCVCINIFFEGVCIYIFLCKILQ